MIILNGYELQFSNYPNGETVLMHELIETYVNQCYNAIELKFEEDGDLTKLYFMKKWIDSQYPNSEKVLTIKYFPYSRVDRSENNSAFTLKYVCDFINMMNFNKVITWENHSYMTEALLNNNRNISRSEEITRYATSEILNNNECIKDYYIYFPDAGAEKRYSKLFNRNQILVGSKKRDFNTGVINGIKVEGSDNINGKKVIIVDDLCSAGGTFYYSALALKEINAGDIYLVVTHCENTIHKGKLLEGNEIKHIYTTDSILTIPHEKITIVN